MSFTELDPKLPCPSKMADGRAFTDYRPRCNIFYDIVENTNKEGFVSSHESRMYLQRNAEKEMERQRYEAIKNLAPCAPCKRPLDDMGTMLPEKYIVKCNEITCKKELFNEKGLGDGRNY